MSTVAVPEMGRILESIGEAVVVADDRGVVRYANPAVTALLGHQIADLLDRPIERMIPSRLRSAHRAGFFHYVRTGHGRYVGGTMRVPALHRDGEEVDIDLSLSAVHADGRLWVVGVMRDATERSVLEQRVEISRYLRATLQTAVNVQESAGVADALGALLPSLCQHLDWDAAVIWRVERARLRAIDVWKAAGTDIGAVEEESLRLSFAPGEGLPGAVWASGEPIVIDDMRQEPSLPRRRAFDRAGMLTGVAFPLLGTRGVIGVCELFSREERPVSEELLLALATIGGQLGQFLDRLAADETVRRLAATLQVNLLPPSLPEIPGLGVAARFLPGAENLLVGGDFYDVFPLSDGRWGFLIGDVCGKGAAAASVAALARHTARAVASQRRGSPSRVLSAVNEALLDTADSPFVTACYCQALVETDGVTLTLARGGHPAPLLVHGGNDVEAVRADGDLLGVMPDAQWTEERIRLRPGDSLLFYTDGVTEARSRRLEEFGVARLAEIFGREHAHGCEYTIKLIEDAVLSHRDERFADDIAMLCLTPRPGGAG